MARNAIEVDLIVTKIDEAQKQIQEFADKSQKRLDKITKSVSFLAIVEGARLAGIAVSKLAGFVGDAVEEGIQFQDVVNSLNVSLASAGVYSEEASTNLQDFAAELQRTTRFGDDAVLSTATLIENITKLGTADLKRATEAALNLSSAMGIDLNTASLAVGKAIEGQTGALQRYGVSVQKGKTETENLNNVLAGLSNQFGGTAQAQVNTFAGATDQLGNAMSDLNKSIGLLIIQNPILIAAFKKINDGIFSLTGVIEANKAVINEFISNTLSSMVKAIGTISNFFGGLAVGLDFIITKIGNAFRGIALFGAAFQELVDRFIRANSLDDLGRAFDGFLKAEKRASESANKSNAAFESRAEAVARTGKAVNKLVSDIQNVDRSLPKTIQGIQNKEVVIPAKIDPKFESDFLSLKAKLELVGLDAAQIAQREFSENSRKIEKARTEGIIKAQEEYGFYTLQNQQDLNLKLIKIQDEASKKQQEAQKSAFESSGIKSAISFATSFVDALNNGREGVKAIGRTLSNTLSEVFKDTPIVGAISNFLTAFFDLLDQPSDQLEKKIQDFFIGSVERALTVLSNVDVFVRTVKSSILENLSNNVAAVVEGIIVSAFQLIAQDLQEPSFSVKLVYGIVEGVVRGLIEGFSSAFKNFPEQIDEIIGQFDFFGPFFENIGKFFESVFDEGLFQSLISTFSRAGDQFISKMSNAGEIFKSSIVQSAGDFIKKIIDGAGDFVKEIVKKAQDSVLSFGGLGGSSGGGGGGGIPSPKDVLKKLKFAEGGEVPGTSFSGDNVLARLNSGELVIDRSTTKDLKQSLKDEQSFNQSVIKALRELSSGNSSQNLTVNISVGEQELASVLLNLNRQGFRTA